MRVRQEIVDDMIKILNSKNVDYKKMKELIQEADENHFYDLTVSLKPMTELMLKRQNQNSN